VQDISAKLDVAKVKRLLQRAPEALQAAILLASEKLLSEMRTTAAAIVDNPRVDPTWIRHAGPSPAVAFGNLARSIDFEVRTQPPFGGVLFVKPPADVYALPVETGTRPHFPPPAALLPWVKKKHPGIAEPEAKTLAFLAARKISKVGTTGIFFFERTRAAHEPAVEPTYDAALDEAIARLEGGE